MITRRRSISLMGATALTLTASGTVAPVLAADPPITGDSHDPMFSQPYIDIDEWRDVPVRHRYVHGGFKGTDCLFSFYLPPKEQYQGRFFQPIGAVSGNENAAQLTINTSNPAIQQETSTIGFAAESGAYLVESNLGSKVMYPNDTNHAIIGYKASAAVAKYSRTVAAEMYGPHRPYGYCYGGSGGSQKTISGFENTVGVWDGAVPYVTGSPMSLPNIFSVQAHALRILRDKLPAIFDATDPGGSGDPYAGLNEEEHAALKEVSGMGTSPRTWFASYRMGYGPQATTIGFIKKWDPQYYDEFWKVPGYLGANPTESLKKARVQHKTTITKIVMSDEARKLGMPVPMAAIGTNVVPAAIQVIEIPPGELLGADLFLLTGAAKGHALSVGGVAGGMINLGISEEAFPFANSVKVGDEVMIDNSIYLASQTYHRHQVPPSREYYVWDQFRGPDGKPIYPQRPVILGPKYAENGCGSFVETGKWPGKMIVVETLMDEYAPPWQADWYRTQVKKVLGPKLDDKFRLYYFDNATHGRPVKQTDNTRIVAYTGVLQQALRDLAAWVEKGVAPPAATEYKVFDGLIEVPATAAARKGVQPVVTVTANGGAHAEVAVGKPVTFSGTVEAPPGTGKVIQAEWDFEGAGDYPVAGKITLTDASGSHATVTTTYTFSKPGTYFAALRVASQREGNTNSPFARAFNLGRARVVVT